MNVNIVQLRHRAFKLLLHPVSARYRDKRMRDFQSRVQLREGMSVLDLGGQPEIWSGIAPKLRITILNLPGIARQEHSGHHDITFVEGDACDAKEYGDRSFDLVFSNSVIEHVGPPDRQGAFASEVRRIGKAYWVQTPAIWFPVEAHSGMPFWWFYPQSMRNLMIRTWSKHLPAWSEMVEGTTVLRIAQLQALFPEGKVYVERAMGIPKSYSVYWP